MVETRKLAAILAADVVGFSRLAGANEDRILARLRTLRSDLIDPTIAVHKGRVVKRTGDGAIIEFRSVVDAVRCAIEVQNAMAERNSGVPEESRIEFRIGVHLGDVVEEEDGDLMGDGVNIAARLEGVAEPGAICLSEDAYRQVRGAARDLTASRSWRNEPQEHRRAGTGLFARARHETGHSYVIVGAIEILNPDPRNMVRLADKRRDLLNRQSGKCAPNGLHRRLQPLRRLARARTLTKCSKTACSCPPRKCASTIPRKISC